MPELATTLLQRVAKLSPRQRRRLAARIAAETTDPMLGKQQLVAYVAGAAGEIGADAEVLREFVRERLPDYMVPPVFTVLAELPRTAVGKIDRAALYRPATALEQATGKDGDDGAARNETEALLAGIWSEVLGIEQPGVHDDFFELGGDSLLSIRILARARQRGLAISPEAFFAQPTIAAQAIAAREAAPAVEETGQVGGPLPLTPIQHWFFEQMSIDPDQWNQSVLLEVPRGVGFEFVDAALRELLAQHDQLRARFEMVDDDWRQIVGEPASASCLSRHALDDAAGDEVLQIATVASQLSASISLAQGGLLRAVYFAATTGPDRLLLVAHHLIVDALSWQILLGDLRMLCSQQLRGERLALPGRTTTFARWASLLVEYAGHPDVIGEADWWRDRFGADVFALPVDDVAATGNTNVMADCRSVSLDGTTSRALLNDVPGVFHARIEELLLAALGRVLAEWATSADIQFDLEGHGREPIFDGVDLSRTVGWFTTVYPVRLRIDPDHDAGQSLQAVKEQLRRVPGRGLGHGLNRYLAPDRHLRAQLRALPASGMLFNYLGQAIGGDAEFRELARNIGEMRSPRGRRAYVIEVNTQLVDGRLVSHWHFNRHIHQADTIDRLGDAFHAELRALIECAQAPGAGGHTPSDFPLAELEQDELDGLANLLDQLDEDT